MSDLARELKNKTQQAEKYVQLGIGAGESLKEALKRFYEVLREIASKDGRELKETYKLMKGKRFQNEGKFLLNGKANGEKSFRHTAVSNAELKEFERLCQNYGIDYLYQKRPANLEELFKKKQNNLPLSKNQEKIVDAFTFHDANGNLQLKDDAALITFSENDLDLMEKVVDRMEERSFNIEQRKVKAEQIVKKAKEMKDKAKQKVKQKTPTQSK